MDNQDKIKQSRMRKVALTSLAGTSIEWYDFFLYGTAAALIFPVVFFPEDMPTTIALIASFSTFAVGFLARPLGGIVFGHFGDRVGRKRTLVIALMLMGLATTLIGLLPGYASIGVTAPLILVILRFMQGLAIGGQWGGAMLLVTENAPPDKRGWYGAYAQAGAPVGVILANLAFLGVSNTMSDADFIAWGWRLPFLASIVLIGISMFVQIYLEDTDSFKALAKSAASPAEGSAMAARSPILDVLIHHPRKVALATGAFLSIQVTFYILVAFIFSYGTSPTIGLSRDAMLTAVLISAFIMIFIQFWASGLSDRVGRRKVFMWGAVLSGLWGFAVFPLIEFGNVVLAIVAIATGLSFLGLQYGPQAAFFAELFSTRIRYSGASLGYQLGAILGGAMAPTIAVMLWTQYSIFFVSCYIALAALLTLISVSLLEETSGSNLDEI